METLLVRLKPYDRRRGHVLRRFAYRGIKFQDDRGWYRVERAVGEYLRGVRQTPGDEHAPPAFDVCTEGEAKALDAKEEKEAKVRKTATDEIQVSAARTDGAVTTADLPDDGGEPAKGTGRRTRKA